MCNCKKMRYLSYMNNDIAFDVLSRLSTKDLRGAKCVCKEWHCLISDRTFLSVQAKNREPISGFFIQQRLEVSRYDIETINYIPVERVGNELQQTVFHFLPEAVVLLGSCNGLLCCRSTYPYANQCLYICNPLNKEFLRLDWREPLIDVNFALAFDPRQDPAHISTKFKVVRVRELANRFSFEIFSSETGEWKKSTETCGCRSSMNRNKGVYIGGVLHWKTDGDEILTFNLSYELSLLVSLPVPAAEFEINPRACIGESDERLHCVLVSEHGLQVWVLEDYFESRWSLNHSKSIKEMEDDHPEFFCNLLGKMASWERHVSYPYMDLLAFKDGYLLMRANLKILQFDIEANKVQLVCMHSLLGCRSVSFAAALPYSPSLVPL